MPPTSLSLLAHSTSTPIVDGEEGSGNRMQKYFDLAREECDIVVEGDPAMERLIEILVDLRNSNIIITLVGEPGVGKYGLSLFIHKVSGKGGPFVPVNISEFSESVLESELFGHERGAYTGAENKRVGRFEEVLQNGTILLDEIGHLSLEEQKKLLIVLSRQRSFSRVGSNAELKVQGRIVCATNADIDAEVEAERMRKDFRDRISACRLRVPPLRERTSKHQEMTVNKLVSRFGTELSIPILDIDKAATDYLLTMNNDRNVRGIESVVEMSAAFVSSDNRTSIQLSDVQRAYESTEHSDLSPHKSKVAGPKIHAETSGEQKSLIIEVPFDLVARGGLNISEYATTELSVAALKSTGGQLSKAGRLLGINRSTIRAHLIKRGLRQVNETEIEKI